MSSLLLAQLALFQEKGLENSMLRRKRLDALHSHGIEDFVTW